MEGNQRKLVMLGICLGCLILSGGIFFYFNHGTGENVLKSLEGQKMWVLCCDPECRTSYEVDKRAYFEFIQEHKNPAALGAPPMVCEKCGKESVYAAEKCPKCGYVFFSNTISGDFADRCPKCRYSETEDIRKGKK